MGANKGISKGLWNDGIPSAIEVIYFHEKSRGEPVLSCNC